MPIVRFLKTLVVAPFRSRLSPLDESRIHLLTWPSDLDIALHMNNGRYLTLMDLGRYDLMARLGFLTKLRKRGWLPVVASATIRFRRSLALFQGFTLRTRIVGWDDRWIFLQQAFERRGQVVALGVVRTAIRSRGKAVPTRDVLAAAGHAGPSPEIPTWIREWYASESSASTKATDGT